MSREIHHFGFGSDKSLRHQGGSVGSEQPLTSNQLITFLTHLLPYSLPLLRRLQFGVLTDSTILLIAGLDLKQITFSPQETTRQARERHQDPATIEPSDVWTIALIHRDGHPSTEVWWFSSLEICHGSAPHDKEAQPANVKPKDLSLPFTSEVSDAAKSQMAKILSYVPVENRQPGVDLFQQVKTPKSPGCLSGCTHTTVAALLEDAGLVIWGSPPYGVYGYAVPLDTEGAEPAAGSSEGLPEGLIWSTIGPQDYQDVMAVNKIIRSPATIAALPSVAVRKIAPREGDIPGKAIAFVFAAGDGSMRTMHVDEEYRRRGLARAIARRLMKTGVLHPPKDGPLAADADAYEAFEKPEPLATSNIEKANTASINTFKSIGAKWCWDVYWIWMDLDRATELSSSGHFDNRT